MNSPVGPIMIQVENNQIILIDFQSGSSNDQHPVLDLAEQQLEQYFQGKRTTFDLPFTFTGTPFQKKCYQALCKIPYGQVIYYGKLAEMVGNPKAARAVGQAIHCNPLSIIVPCHRVIGKNGQLVGYAGGLQIKKILLDGEKSKWQNIESNVK